MEKFGDEDEAEVLGSDPTVMVWCKPLVKIQTTLKYGI